MKTARPKISAFREVPRTGVIFVNHEAARHGYSAGDPGWCNLGQAGRFRPYARFSFGPPLEVVRLGLQRLGELIHG